MQFDDLEPGFFGVHGVLSADGALPFDDCVSLKRLEDIAWIPRFGLKLIDIGLEFLEQGIYPDGIHCLRRGEDDAFGGAFDAGAAVDVDAILFEVAPH